MKTEKMMLQSKKMGGKKPLRVVLLSGFLGSGKTTLVKQILTSSTETNANLRIAVIVNEITAENLDYVNLQGSKLVNVGSESVVEMSNGCICCTLRLDLMRQLYELWGTQRYDAVVIESSGVSDPSEVAESFFVPVPMSDLEPEGTHDPSAMLVMQTITPLVNCVTVVDASTIDEYLASDGTTKDLDSSASPEDERSISQLLFMQMEFASVIVLNKVDLISAPKGSTAVVGQKRAREADGSSSIVAATTSIDSIALSSVRSLATKINPVAELYVTSQCKVAVDKLLRLDATGADEIQTFARNMMVNLAERSAGVFVADVEGGQLRVAEGAVMPDHVPETEEFQISSHVFRSDRPFHPRRLYDWMTNYFVLVQLRPNEDHHHDHDDDGVCQAGGGDACVHSPAPNKGEVANLTSPAQRALKRKERYGNLYRGKGYCWLGTYNRSDQFGSWSQAGSSLSLIAGGHWDDDFPWDHPTLKQQQETTTTKKGGSKKIKKVPHQILSFVGQRMKWDVLEADLRGLLLTDEEMKPFKVSTRTGKEPHPLEDPFVQWEIDEEE